MRDLLTPKQVARSIDASESSVKRWCHKENIPTQYTAGGHRRIALADLLRFLRSAGHRLVHPEALGLPATCGQTARVVDRAREQLTEAGQKSEYYTYRWALQRGAWHVRLVVS